MKFIHWLALSAMLTSSTTLKAEFLFTTNDGGITIIGCTGSEGNLVIPDTTNGWPVTTIANYGCSYKDMTNVTMGNNITNIGAYAFWSCLYLHRVTIPKSLVTMGSSAFCGDGNGDLSVFFQGNAPSGFAPSVCGNFYYLPGTTGWEQFIALNGNSGFLWNPQPQTSAGNFGVISNRFGFNIIGTTNIPVAVEGCTNFGGEWVALQFATLTNGSYYFSDSEWTNNPSRFYRIRWP
jgi:hypothetical protein